MYSWNLRKQKKAYKALGVEITDDMTDQEVLDAISYFEENLTPPIELSSRMGNHEQLWNTKIYLYRR